MSFLVRQVGSGVRHSYILLAAVLIYLSWELQGQALLSYNLPDFPFVVLVLFCILLPKWHALATLSIVILAKLALVIVNQEKISWTQFPLTALDLRIFLTNPEGVFDALGVQFPVWAPMVGVTLLGGGLVFLTGHGLWQIRRHRHVVRRTIAMLASTLFVLVSFLFAKSYVVTVQEYANKQQKLWKLERVAQLSDHLGVFGFLAYSIYAESLQTGDFFRAASALEPKPTLVKGATERYVKKVPKALPNIVVLFAESTFDPFYSFTLSGAPQISMFKKGRYTQALGPLKVNTVGGGSWIAEFESLVGIDSRLFGYAGYYTHSTLSPIVERALPSYLKSYGYLTSAYYAADGEFFNARNAFLNYGFDHFADGKQLGLSGWFSTDYEIVQAVINNKEPKSVLGMPFFKYIGLIENHGMRGCTKKKLEELSVKFAKTNDFQMNCMLNEYIRVLHSTSRAFEAIVTYLEELEARTGRPFVVLVFGDHQPHLLHKQNRFERFAPYLDRGDERTTFFHLASSIPGVIDCCEGEPPPITLLPSMLSAFVAPDMADIYLPVNFYAYQQCGSDITSTAPVALDSLYINTSLERDRHCSEYESLIAAYQNSGVFAVKHDAIRPINKELIPRITEVTSHPVGISSTTRPPWEIK